jgi:hypothetical protein
LGTKELRRSHNSDEAAPERNDAAGQDASQRPPLQVKNHSAPGAGKRPDLNSDSVDHQYVAFVMTD